MAMESVLNLPDLVLPDGSMLIDRVLVERELKIKGERNVKGKIVETVESRTYGYVVSTYQPPESGTGAVQRAKTGKR